MSKISFINSDTNINCIQMNGNNMNDDYDNVSKRKCVTNNEPDNKKHKIDSESVHKSAATVTVTNNMIKTTFSLNELPADAIHLVAQFLPIRDSVKLSTINNYYNSGIMEIQNVIRNGLVKELVKQSKQLVEQQVENIKIIQLNDEYKREIKGWHEMVDEINAFVAARRAARNIAAS